MNLTDDLPELQTSQMEFMRISAPFGSTNSSISPFTNTREPLFPYVLNGLKYKKDVFNTESRSLQSLDILNSGDLVRNTFYYKFGFASSQYDFLTQNQIEDTQLIVRSTKDTGISSVSVIVPGQDYQVGDLIRFNNDNSSAQEDPDLQN